ncbi:MAG: biotin-dependent carboxyltransferase family protein, partial [Micropruina sp.]
ALVDGRGVAPQAPFYVGPGQTLTLGRPAHGFRSYVSVRGGLIVTPVLSSASTDTLSGIGPAPLAVGDVLPVGPTPDHEFPGVELVGLPASGGRLVLHARLGPRADWLADPAALTTQEWTVTADSNRVGVRLSGVALARSAVTLTRELPSEGVVRGGIQVPAGGQPLIFGADHPVTGGYPVVAVLTEASSDALAQARPGDQLRLRLIDR